MLRSGREITGEKKYWIGQRRKGQSLDRRRRRQKETPRERAPGPAGCVLSERMDVIRLCLAAAARRGVISQCGLCSLIRCNA